MTQWNVLQFLKSGAIMHLDVDHVLVGYGQAYWLNFNQINKRVPAFYFPDFFLITQHCWLQFAHWEKISVQDLIDRIDRLDRSIQDTPSPLEWHPPDSAIFYHNFAKLQNDFILSKLKKAVPYAFSQSQSKMSIPRLIHSLKSALHHKQKYRGYIYGFWNESEGILGVTPEILFQYNLKSNVLSTVALAGTCTKETCLESFQTNPKEQIEHAFVIEGIKQALDCFGKITIEKTSVLELSSLNHLITPISVQMSHLISFKELVEAMHPTPALGAYPKKEGWLWLQEYAQKLPRYRYGAPVGLFYQEQNFNHCLVGIRNVQWDAEGMRIGAGCGVIKSSQYEQEWKEINLKLHAIRECLSL